MEGFYYLGNKHRAIYTERKALFFYSLFRVHLLLLVPRLLLVTYLPCSIAIYLHAFRSLLTRQMTSEEKLQSPSPETGFAAVVLQSPLEVRVPAVLPLPVRIDIYRYPGFPPTETIWHGLITQTELNQALESIVEQL